MHQRFDPDNIALELVAAWHEGAQPAALRQVLRPATLQDAYDIQDRLIAKMESPLVGWKIGLAGRNAYRGAGLIRPIFRGIPASRLFRSGDTVPVPRAVPVTVELELALVIAEDIESGDPVTPALVRSTHLGFEIVSSRLPDRNTIGAAATVADNAVSHAVVLGNAVSINHFAVLAAQANVNADDRPAATGLLGSDLPDPLSVVGHLVAHLSERRRRLKSGDVVFTGTLTKPFDVMAPCALSGGGPEAAVQCRLHPRTD
jgi:2-keto-4-pentenoate hydratase